jgi:anti-anti-sigma regulatory factor
MNITKHAENDIAVFAVEGRIDFLSVLEMDDALQTTISVGQHNIVLDMTRVQYINSAGLRTLAALDPMVMLIFEMVGFDRHLPLIVGWSLWGCCLLFCYKGIVRFRWGGAGSGDPARA